MGYRHTKTEILDGALAVAFDDGLSQLTYGRVAKQLGTSDRVIVYYFPSKEDLVGEVLVGVGIQLQQALEPAFRSPAGDHLQLIKAAWPVMARVESDAVFSLFLEAAGLAASGREPYCTLVPQLVEAWITWAADYLQGTPAQRRAEAETAIAILDGLLLLRQMAGSAAANRAAKRIGTVGRN
jgi:AcrR family transcriptional regulator